LKKRKSMRDTIEYQQIISSMCSSSKRLITHRMVPTTDFSWRRTNVFEIPYPNLKTPKRYTFKGYCKIFNDISLKYYCDMFKYYEIPSNGDEGSLDFWYKQYIGRWKQIGKND